jgi:hypothetical protein
MTREGSDFKRKNRIELLVLFPTGPMRRQLPQLGKPEAAEAQKAPIDRMFGDQSWRPIYLAQRDGLTTGEDSWLHYVELYRLRLLGLGYKHTAAIEVRNTNNVVLYHMVFATGHPAGARIMGAILEKARQVLPQMVNEEREARRSSDQRLFEQDLNELETVANDPARWAKLYDQEPTPFDASRLPTASTAAIDEIEQLGFILNDQVDPPAV